MVKRLLMTTTAGLLLTLAADSVTAQDGERRMERGERGDDAGALKVLQMAPPFTLKSLNGESDFELAAFKGKKPVVLFFGSYT